MSETIPPPDILYDVVAEQAQLCALHAARADQRVDCCLFSRIPSSSLPSLPRELRRTLPFSIGWRHQGGLSSICWC